MALTRNYKETVLSRIRRDPAFGAALYKEATTALLEGDTAVAFSILRDLVHARISFKRLASRTHLNEKSLLRMLSAKGNPTAEHTGRILKSVREELRLKPVVSVKRVRPAAREHGEVKGCARQESNLRPPA